MAVFVNKERLKESIIQKELEMLLYRHSKENSSSEIAIYKQMNEDAKQNAIETLILNQQARKEIEDIPSEEIDRRAKELILQYATNNNLDVHEWVDPEFEQMLKKSLPDIIKTELYFDKICKDVQPPDEEECRAFYNENKEKFKYPRSVRASHIIRTPQQGETPQELIAEMMNIREQLLNGADFAETANTYSQCDDNGGDLGWFDKSKMVPEFANVVFSMDVGEISDVFPSQFGFHIVKLFDQREGGCLEFEEVRYEIETEILNTKKNNAIGLVVDKLRENSVIEEIEDSETTDEKRTT